MGWLAGLNDHNGFDMHDNGHPAVELSLRIRYDVVITKIVARGGLQSERTANTETVVTAHLTTANINLSRVVTFQASLSAADARRAAEESLQAWATEYLRLLNKGPTLVSRVEVALIGETKGSTLVV
jgi:hypothetical protein